MADTQFTLRGAPAALVALLSAASAQGAIITRTKAAKLLYLADIQSVAKLGRPGSAVQWRWLHYGPFSNALLSVEDELVRSSVVEREITENYFGSPEYRLRLRQPVPPVAVDEEFAKIIEGIVGEYGQLAASTLRDLTYQTPPMREAQREGVRGESLDLLTGQPVPDISPVLRHFQSVLDRAEEQDDEGDLAGLAEEIEEWTPGRVRATGSIVDD